MPPMVIDFSLNTQISDGIKRVADEIHGAKSIRDAFRRWRAVSEYK